LPEQGRPIRGQQAMRQVLRMHRWRGNGEAMSGRSRVRSLESQGQQVRPRLQR